MKQLIALLVVSFAVLLLTVRGISGTPTTTDLLSDNWKLNGPFDLSPERGRYALLYSLAEDHSFSFSLPIARFTTPDLGYINGKYVSLFAPGVSFAVLPGYLAGKAIGIGQVGAFLVIAAFALANAALVWMLARHLGAHPAAATLAALSFLFGTPAFTYATTLYQHHISTFLLLLSVWSLVVWRMHPLRSLALVWFSAALSVNIDYPNFFMMLPVTLVAGTRLFALQREKKTIVIRLYAMRLLTLLAVLPPLVFFLWTNAQSYGNPLQLAGTVGAVVAIDESGKPTTPAMTVTAEAAEVLRDPTKQKKSAIGFFKSRNLLGGFIIHFLSPDRGVTFFAPIMLFTVFGAVGLYRRRERSLPLLISIMGVNILLYSMWGDPWGGWAFGSRYLIPSYAIASIFIAQALTAWSKKTFWAIVVFFVGFSVSTAVNTVGALTSDANPPKIQVLALEQVSGRQEKYTVERNWDLLRANASKSFVFQTFIRSRITALHYAILVWGTLYICAAVLLVDLVKHNAKEQ